MRKLPLAYVFAKGKLEKYTFSSVLVAPRELVIYDTSFAFLLLLSYFAIFSVAAYERR